jgi:hypothetical protein
MLVCKILAWPQLQCLAALLCNAATANALSLAPCASFLQFPDVANCVLQKLLGASDAHNAVLPALPAGMGGVASHGEMTRRGRISTDEIGFRLPHRKLPLCLVEAFQCIARL